MRGRKSQRAGVNREVVVVPGHALLIITEGVNLDLDRLSHVRVIVHDRQVVTGLGGSIGQGRGIESGRGRAPSPDTDHAHILLDEGIHDRNRGERGDHVRIPEAEGVPRTRVGEVIPDRARGGEVDPGPGTGGDLAHALRNEGARRRIRRREIRGARAQGPAIGDDRDQSRGTLVIVMVRSHRIGTRIESYLLFIKVVCTLIISK